MPCSSGEKGTGNRRNAYTLLGSACSAGFCLVLLGFACFRLVMLGSAWFCLVLLGSACFYFVCVLCRRSLLLLARMLLWLLAARLLAFPRVL